MTNERPGSPAAETPSDEDVADILNQLVALEARDPTAFAEALADNVMDPEPSETMAFRSAELAFKSAAAARYLIERTEEQERRFRNDAARLRGVRHFKMRVTRELRVLQHIVDGERAKSGFLPNSPNPLRRAEKRLRSEAMAGAVPAGRWRELVEEEKEKDRERKRQAKKARQAERKKT